MKKWFQDNRIRLFISSVLTLLPILYGVLFWKQLPDSFTTHWGADGAADSVSGKGFVVFGIPLICFALNILCAVGVYLDKNNRNKNKKAMGIVFWISPFISILISVVTYKLAMADSNSFDFVWIFPLIFGLLFLVMGNYMPKVSQNRTLGIKIYWTLANEENWNKTHRLAGRIWVAGGVVMLATAFLPIKWIIGILLALVFVMILVPYLYSYRIYNEHKKQGIVYGELMKTKGDMIGKKATLITLPLVLIGVVVLMFTGSITYEFTEDSLKIDATYGDNSVVNFAQIDSVEYREDFDFGFRNYGFGSAKFSIGNFKNSEFGNYTLYSYTACSSAVVIKIDDRILVINGKDIAETKWLYDSLVGKIG